MFEGSSSKHVKKLLLINKFLNVDVLTAITNVNDNIHVPAVLSTGSEKVFHSFERVLWCPKVINKIKTIQVEWYRK